jgi:hypothetical protein
MDVAPPHTPSDDYRYQAPKKSEGGRLGDGGCRGRQLKVIEIHFGEGSLGGWIRGDADPDRLTLYGERGAGHGLPRIQGRIVAVGKRQSDIIESCAIPAN